MNERLVDLSVQIGRLKLKNPVMPASGTFGYGEEFSDFIDLNELGAIVTKGTSLKPRLGNPEHRFMEIAGCAHMISIGLQNVGIDDFIRLKLPFLRNIDTPVIVNVAGDTTDEFIRIAELLSRTEGIAGLELNMTCPNVERGGRQFSADPETAFGLVKAVRGVTPMTIIAKLTPGWTEIGLLAKACEEAGADAVCPNYSVLGMAVDIHTRGSKMGKNLMGGVGGPWRKPVAVRMAFQAAKATKLPVIGCGGITSAEDAVEFFIVGASAVEIGTFNLVNPRVTTETISGLRKYLVDHGYGSIKDIIGSFEAPSLFSR